MSIRGTGMNRDPFPGFPPPLTNRPEGLLSLLGIQTNGCYPQTLDYSKLVPTLDLLGWYCEAEQDYPTATFNLTANGFQSAQTVPNDEQWLVLGGSVISPAALGTAHNRVTLVKANSQGTGIVPLSESYDFAFGRKIFVGTDGREKYLLCRPTTQLGVWQEAATPADSIVVQFRVVRLAVA